MRASKWNQGVALYAKDLLDNLNTSLYPPEKGRPIKLADALCGAANWLEFSYGGCGLIWDADIAERLATPTEIKSRTSKKHGLSCYVYGSTTWLDLQARALGQAFELLNNPKN